MVTASVGETILGTLGPAAFAVYWHLAKRSKDGQCWPSLDDIADSTKQSRMHVTRMLDALERDGWITRTKRSNAYGMATSTLYTLVEKPRTDGCNIAVTSHEHDRPSDVTRTRLKPDVEPEEEKPPLSPKPKAKTAPSYDEGFLAFWSAYVAHDHNARSKKPESAKLWAALSDDEQAAALAAIPAFAAGRDWQEGFVPGAQVWLRARKWEHAPRPAAVSDTGKVDWNDPAQVEAYRRRTEQAMLRQL